MQDCRCVLVSHRASRSWHCKWGLGLIFRMKQTKKWLLLAVADHEDKVKFTLVQALRLCTGCTAHRGSRDIALLFLDHSTRRGWGVSITLRMLFTPGKDPVPIVQETGWAPGPVWTGAENLAPTGIWSLDHPALSQSLYRLSYPAHDHEDKGTIILHNVMTYSTNVSNITKGASSATPLSEPQTSQHA